MTIKAPTGCIEPELGAKVSERLGLPLALDALEARHVEECLACALERRAWDEARRKARPLPERFVERLMREAADASKPRP